MKIIGQANEGYIVNVSSVELANILGLYSSYDSEFREAVNRAIKYETDIPISDIYKHYYNLKSVVASPEYDTARAKLTKMLEALTPIDNLLKQEMEALNEDNKS